MSESVHHFWASKSANRRVNAELSALSFSTNCTWKHVGRDLFFNVLAAWKMFQVSSQHLSLPHAQLGLEQGCLNVNRRLTRQRTSKAFWDLQVLAVHELYTGGPALIEI